MRFFLSYAHRVALLMGDCSLASSSSSWFNQYSPPTPPVRCSNGAIINAPLRCKQITLTLSAGQVVTVVIAGSKLCAPTILPSCGLSSCSSNFIYFFPGLPAWPGISSERVRNGGRITCLPRTDVGESSSTLQKKW